LRGGKLFAILGGCLTLSSLEVHEDEV